jgi:cobalt-zinc-cadmium efflux system membrane fusion protein
VKTTSAPLFLLLAIVATGLFTACTEAPPPHAAEPQPIIQGNQLRYPTGHPQLSLLQTTAATQAQSLAVDLPAKLVWNEEKTQRIYAPFSGRVSAIRADLGQNVRAGSALLQLASPDFGMAQADAAKATADKTLADKALQRQRELFSAGIIARKELEQAEADAARAGAEAERALVRTRLYGSAASVNQQLTLSSDIAGVVVERNVNPGQEIRAEQGGPGSPALFVVTDPTQLWVQIDAREADIAALQPGASFSMQVPALPGQTFEGKVSAAADFIDPNTRTIKIRGAVANPQRLLKGEMLATVHIERKLGEGVMVPATAVLLRGTQHWVYVQTQPGVFEPREVKISHEGAKESLVTQGLQAGELVVSSNNLLLAREFKIAQDAQAPTQKTQADQP